MITYDGIYLDRNEYGNEVMAAVAQVYFQEHPHCRFVLVYEHGGWCLGYRRDMTIWATANDTATLDDGPRPERWSGREERREKAA